MHVDLCMEFASPPADGRHGRDVFEDGLALARAADVAGLGAVWLAEHHFLGDYCNAAAPDMLLAAMARETERIKLGFAIVPLPIHDPVRVAERLATLDLLSGGRVLWGVGRGVTVTELEGFGIEPADSCAVFRQRFTELKAMLDTGTAVRGGKAFELRPRPGPGLGTGGFFDGDTLFYQGTLLIDTDPADMVAALKVPREKLAKRGLDSAARRVVTLKDLLGDRLPGRPAIRDALLSGLAEGLGIEPVPGEITEFEEALARELHDQEIGTDAFVAEIDEPDGGEDTVSASHTGAGGTVTVSLRLKGPAKDRVRQHSLPDR